MRLPDQGKADPEWLLDCRTQLSKQIGRPYRGRLTAPISGGCIHRAWHVAESNGLDVFIKTNHSEYASMFRVEAAGLDQLRATETIRLPKPLGVVCSREKACLILEWLPMVQGNELAWRKLAQQLAALHAVPTGPTFGWERDNFIGTTPQSNRPSDSWADFFLEQRLDVQIEYARRKGREFFNYERLRARAKVVLSGQTIKPAWVHGDLWAGNAGFSKSGEPLLFDVACYRGDPEVDLAMTRLFGGFPAAFYQAYHQDFPQREGHEWRCQLYNLYHILNHDHLFGGSYASQAQGMIDSLIRCVS